MRRYVAVLLSLLFLVILASALASAQQPAQPMWRIYLRTDDGNGMYGFDSENIGVYPGSTDGYGLDGAGTDPQDAYFGALRPTMNATVATFGNHTWGKDIKSPRSPMDSQYDAYDHRKVWFLRSAGMGSASTATPIRLTFRHISTPAGLPPLTLPYTENGVMRDLPVRYYIKMTDNRGVAGAPANGTLWAIPMPATLTTTPFFSLTLPTINISVPMSEQSFIDDGYKLEFHQELVVPELGDMMTPEPGSLMALACGVMGLGGMFLRRKK